MMTEHPLDTETLDRYLGGTASAEDRVRTERWFAADRAREERVGQLLEALDSPRTYAPADVIANSAWQRFSQRRAAADGARGDLRRPARRGWGTRAAVWAAAGSALVAIVFAIQVGQHSGRQAPPVRQYQTVAGQSATLILGQGTQVVLGPQSRIRIETNASTRANEVQVTGQAMFTVTHDDRAPFLVRTKTTSARVLGTQFMVRDYPEDRTGVVLVTEGRVGIRSVMAGTDEPQVVLAQGELGVIDDSGRIITRTDSMAAQLVAWTNGELVFRETSVAEIITDLNRAYGVHVRIADSSLAKRRLTWSVQVNELPVTHALRELSLLLGAHLVRVHDTVTVVPGRRMETPPSLRTPLPQESYYGR